MTSQSSATQDVKGAQRPNVCSVPHYVSSAGEEAVELAQMAGLELDPWEAFVLSQALGEDEAGKWAAFEVGLVVSRQNGKGAILEARELAGLFLLGERMIIHSAHQFDTSLEAFRRLLTLIEDTPDLDSRVKRVSRSHGEEGIELKGGQRIRFRTRTKGGGRGFSSDCLILDEAMEIPETAHGALLPTLSARPNPQVWYTGSAVDQWFHDHGVVLSRLRERGMKGDASLAYFEWSASQETPDQVAPELVEDPKAWAAANPGLGIRISPDHVDRERRSMDPRTFVVERLGIGDWPRTDGVSESVISIETWQRLVDVDSRPADPVCFAFDVAPDRSYAAIGVAGAAGDKTHLEIVQRDRGTAWVPARLAELRERHEPKVIICDARGPAGSLLGDLETAGVPVTTVTTVEYGQACGLIFDAVNASTIAHLGTAELTAAIKGAARRPLGDAWAWSRKSSSVDISPLVAVTLAHWGLQTQGRPSVYEERGLLTLT